MKSLDLIMVTGRFLCCSHVVYESNNAECDISSHTTSRLVTCSCICDVSQNLSPFCPTNANFSRYAMLFGARSQRPTPHISIHPHLLPLHAYPVIYFPCPSQPCRLYRPGCCPANPGPSLVHPALLIPSSIRPQILSTTSLSLHRPFSLPVHLSTLALSTPRPKPTILLGVSSPCHPTYTPG